MRKKIQTCSQEMTAGNAGYSRSDRFFRSINARGPEPVTARVRFIPGCHFRACGGVMNLLLFSFAVFWFSVSAPVFGEDEPEKRTETVRELFVPDEHLGTLLEGCTDRTMLSREEYEKLVLETAKLKALEDAENKAVKPPLDFVITDSDYRIKVLGERAIVEGTLEIETFSDRLIAVPLNSANVSIRNASTGGKPARIGGTPGEEPLRLFINEKGKHKFELQMTTPLHVDSTRQELRFQVPRAPQLKVRLEVPGDVELKSGAAVMNRKVEGEGTERKTVFELLEKSDSFHWVMSLNSHKMRMIRTVLLRSVQFDELTETYERLHSTFSLDVLHQGIERFAIEVPKGFDVTDVRSPMLSRWAVDAEKNILEVFFREPVTGQCRLEVAAIRNFSDGLKSLENWSFPQFEPQDVSSNVSVLGLLLDSRLEVGEIRTEKLLPIDTAQLAGAIPSSALEALPGAPTLRLVSSWYAPNGLCGIKAEFTRPESSLEVVTNLVLSLNEQKQSLTGAFLLTPRAEKLFKITVRVPNDWVVRKVSDERDVPMNFEPKKIGDENFVQIRLPRGINPGETYRVLFEASGTSEGWLDSWVEHSLEFPAFAVKDTVRDHGTLALIVDQDLIAVPKESKRLVPLDEKEKAKYLAGLDAKLSYRYFAQPYSLELSLAHAVSRSKATTYSFYRIEPSILNARYEIVYDVEEARTKELVFLLPGDTSETPGIQGLDGLQVKEYNSETIESDGKTYRKWTVSLAVPSRGILRIAVDLEKPISEGELDKTEEIELPMVRAENVAWQSGMLTVEGHEELNIEIPDGQSIRSVDLGELSEADYIPGRRLLGVYNLTVPDASVRISMLRNPGYSLTPTIVQEASARAVIGLDGRIMYEIDYLLKTKTTFVMIDLKPGEKLWSVMLDNKVLRPQRNGSSLMIDIPAKSDSILRPLRLVFSTENKVHNPEECTVLCGALGKDGKDGGEEVKDSGQLRKTTRYAYDANVRIPDLMVPRRLNPNSEEGDKKPEETGPLSKWEKIPVAKLTWKIEPPKGFELVRYGNDVNLEVKKREAPRPALFDIGSKGLTWGRNLFSGFASAREAASKQMILSVPVGTPAYHDELYNSAEIPMDACAPEEAAEMDAFDEDDFFGVFEEEKSRDSAKKDGMLGRVEPAKSAKELPKSEPRPVPSAAAPVPQNPPPPSIPEEPQVVRGKRLETVQPVSIVMQEGSNRTNETIIESIGDNGYGTLELKLLDTSLVKLLSKISFALFTLIGLLLLRCEAKTKWRFLFWTLVIGTLLVFVPGLEFFGPIFNNAVFAVVLLVLPIYLICGLCRWLCPRCRKSKDATACETNGLKTAAGSVAMFLLFSFGFSVTVNAQETAPPALNPDEIGKIMVQLIQGSDEKPVIPEDIVLVPYDGKGDPNALPSAETLRDPKQTVFVSSKRYRELLDLIDPERKKKTDDTPALYALAGAEYKAKLETAARSDRLQEDLLIEGTIRIELYTEKPVLVPFTVFGGALDEVTLDEKKAELGFGGILTDGGNNISQNVALNPSQTAMVQQNLYQAPQAESVQGSIYMLSVQGKGEHVLKWKARYDIQRQGGWRFVSGRLPVAPATSLELALSAVGDELRTGNVLDQRKWTAEKDNQSFETTLAPNGSFHWQWRSKVTEGEIDYNLKVNSEAFFDVQESGYRLNWTFSLSIGGGRHETFRFKLPKDYQVASVEGLNVRGWTPAPEEANPDSDAQVVDVELLKPADATENITFTLWKNQEFKEGEKLEPSIPLVSVTNAAMHRGRITVRHSPLLNVTIKNVNGAERTDLPTTGPTVNNAARTPENPNTALITESPLGIKPVQAYRFTSENYRLSLSVVPLKAELSTEERSILKLSEFEARLESSMKLYSKHRSIYQAEIQLPDGFKLENVNLPGAFEWSVREKEGNKILSVYLAKGQPDSLTIVIDGVLASTEAEDGTGKLQPIESVSIPKLSFLGVPKDAYESKSLVVFADPAFDVSVTNLKNCMRESTGAHSWIKQEHRQLARVALAISSKEDYDATFSLKARKPDITVNTISNTSVKRQSIEDMIAIIYKISIAGTRSVEFDLPLWMKDARIECPLLARKTVTINEDSPDKVNVKLELQDDVMGELQVLVRHDRLLISGKDYPSAIPNVKNARTMRQYLVLENTQGLDEIESKYEGMKPLSRQLKEWAELESFLGNARGNAYVVNLDESNVVPSLSFKTKTRELIKMSGARIGLSETRLAIGQGGAYRGEQVYHIDNKTEQYLDIRLPHGSELWVARILSAAEWKERERDRDRDYGEPVKPCLMPADGIFDMMAAKGAKADMSSNMTDPHFIRIPLVKTEVGDADYVVRLVYAGKMPSLKSLDNVNFPLIQVRKNIHIDSSVVRLYLPENFRYKFDGKLSPVEENEKVQAISQLKSSYDRQLYDRLQTTVSTSENDFERIRANVSLNDLYNEDRSLEERSAMNGTPRREQVVIGSSNSVMIEERFRQQDNRKARNIVSQSENNWRADEIAKSSSSTKANDSFQGSEWLDSNKLNRDTERFAQESKLDSSSMFDGPETLGFEDRDERGRGLEKKPQNEFGKAEFARNLESVDGKIVLDNYSPQQKGIAGKPVAGTKSKAVDNLQLDEVLNQRVQVQQKPAGNAASNRPSRESMDRNSELQQYEQKARQRSYNNSNSNSNWGGNNNDIFDSDDEYDFGEEFEMGNRGTSSPATNRRNARLSATANANANNGGGSYGGGNSAPARPGTSAQMGIPRLEEPAQGGRPGTDDAPTSNWGGSGGYGSGRGYGNQSYGVGRGGQDGERPTGGGADFGQMINLIEMVVVPGSWSANHTSLDIEIPTDGKEYVFTTPRGEIELSGRCVAESDIGRAWGVFCSVLSLLAIYLVCYGCSILRSRAKKG